MKIITTVIAATAFLFPLAAQADHHGAKPTKNVVEIAASAKDFSTLVAAVKAGGLAGALSGEGPFTIFAPTNAAFAKLPEGTVATLLKPENKGKLASILKYHVVAGKVMA
ncbi:fasciclin domain-containing protein, partial [Akkermansiaceae bacterium]|nr:fasciclin domain-containing protein [Akkermansiaceae bacterium]